MLQERGRVRPRARAARAPARWSASKLQGGAAARGADVSKLRASKGCSGCSRPRWRRGHGPSACARCDPPRRAARRPARRAGGGRLERSSRPEYVTTRWSRAASSASSSSWRSSLRTSRSPTSGLRAVRSSPSRSMWRGKLPSSKPEQAHHPVRDGTHRHQRAHRQMTRAEVRPRRSTLQSVVQMERMSSQLRMTALVASSVRGLTPPARRAVR